MKEHGRFFLGENECIAPNGFALTTLKTPSVDPDNIPVEDLEVTFETYEASLADKLFCLGIAKRDNSLGKDVLLIVRPGTQIKV